MVTQHIGKPYPLGSSISPFGINFALVSRSAVEVTLCLYGADLLQPAAQLVLDPHQNKSGDIWHIEVGELQDQTGYAYRVKGPFGTYELLDPYARRIIPRRLPPMNLYHPIAHLPKADTFDWKGDRSPKHKLTDLVLYEMHVGGYTQDPSSGVRHPGTYLGVIEKIPHLLELGVNAVELMPLFEFDPQETPRCCITSKQKLGNYWGYSTVNFFTPATCFSATGDSVTEFRQMVAALHQAGIEVILDVVYNHTAEGDTRGPVLSFKGLDNAIYYMLDANGNYLNYTGCGNTFNCNHPIVRSLILDSLRYWVAEMHVDGFRFDLASIFLRDRHGNPYGHSPLLEAIEEDPLLSQTKLIAEPWDAAGLYHVGAFRPTGRRWSEWNGRYRDAIRRFIKGDDHSKGEFATRLCGSEDLYGDAGTPKNSINFVTAHDGFTLADLVAYNQKHNMDNGEGCRDGTNDNYSWNCGVEGNTEDTKILSRRQRQIRNFMVALILSRGVPMLLMGDEYGHTKQGNNNTWCVDDARNWLQWSQIKANEALFRFYKGMIAIRNTYPILKRNSFYTKYEIEWHGLQPHHPEWGQGIPLIALSLHDNVSGDSLYVAFNATGKPQTFTLPAPSYGGSWGVLIDTAKASPDDLRTQPIPVNQTTITLCDHSAVVLIHG